MPSLDKPEPRATSVTWQLPSVHPDGRKFMVAGIAAALFFMVLGWGTLGWLAVAVTVWLGVLFRDPVRTSPTAPGLIIAPADGLVTLIDTVEPPPELVGPEGLSNAQVVRVSIYISPFDCHIIRSPVAGTIRRLAYVAGRFVNPTFDKASEDNERQHVLVQAEDGTMIGFTQIAGIIGRRILLWVHAGEPVLAGQRVGIIRFGSRCDVYLPPDTGSMVLLGQRTIAGETVLGRIGVSELIEGVAQ